MKHLKGVLYIRHLTPADKARNFMSSLDIALCKTRVENGKRKHVYVLVRHGFPNDVITVGHSKRQIQRNMMFSGGAGKSFKVNARSWRDRTAC